ncbi:hypothetical protein BKA59DRAFT_39811 [Fusarium tricinctum]|jgi:hypothetical protein|uniref:Uncharacterized protein n=1 Tax=Fusarium tricinctum TaxID=61284 RepID=A0A8K0S8N0_9HYPO|nr:hypothetical protein BKA59DRAFT_39811 [Fusarium tricinctum]
MTTLPTLDIHKSTPAVVTWQWNDSTRYLAEPDPQIKRVTFTTRFDTTCAFFELSIPIKLKGIKTSSSIILRIPPSSIDSFDFVSSTTAPEVIHSKFNSTTICLDLQLNQHLQILVPADSHEPLHPIRAQGGIVLDAVRQLANATSFSIYIEALALSNTQLQSVRDVISQGLVPVCNDDLASMYGGSGAKIINIPVDPMLLPPPTYDETEPPPPSAPIYDRKRYRKDSRDERNEDVALIWAQLTMMQNNDAQRMKELKRENDDLKYELAELRDKFTTLLARQKNLEEEFGALETSTQLRMEDLGDEMSVKMTELNDDTQALSLRVDHIEEEHDEDELVDKVKDRVLDHLRTSMSVSID